MGKVKDTRKIKPAKVHEMRAEAAVKLWMQQQQQYAASYKKTAYYKKPEPPIVSIKGYGDSPVNSQGPCTAIPLIGCQTSQKAVFQVTETRGYLILGQQTGQQIGYICFPPKLT